MSTHSRPSARSHRHLVAVPLLLLWALLPLTGMRGAPALASLAPLGDGGVVLELSGGAHALADADGTLLHVDDSRNVLRAGAVLVRTEAMETVEVSDLSFTGWNGAFRVGRLGGRVSVAAVTSPILVADASGTVLVVPPGMQWETGGSPAALSEGLRAWSLDRSPLPLPGVYVVETLRRLRDLPERDAAPERETSVDPSLLQLPAARARSEAGAVRAVLADLLAAADAGDMAGFLGILRGVPDPSVLADADARTLARVVSRAAGHPGMIAQILPVFATSADRWLLSAFHPDVRSWAWLQPIPSFTQEEDLLRLRLLPASDVLAEGITPRAVDRWTEGMHAAFLDAREPAGVLELFASAIHAALQKGERLGYTERTVRYATALLELTEPWEEELPQSVRTAAEAAKRIVGR